MKLILILISINLYASIFDTQKYNITFEGYLITDLDDVDHAVKRQINHSLGPMQNLKPTGKRSSLSHLYTYKLKSITPVDNKLKRIDYIFNGELLIEENVLLDSLKIVLPLRAKAVFEKAQKFRGRCGSNGDLGLFFHSWSPYYKNCALKKGVDFEEFQIASYNPLSDKDQIHFSSEFLVNDKYNFFYYFGSDYFSNSKLGFAETAYNETFRKFKKMGFYEAYDKETTEEIFGSQKTYSRFKRLKGKFNGKESSVFLMVANPTELTPSTRFEFFKFFKYAFKEASSIQYSGHAGLGAILNFDELEELYQEKIEYNLNQKQLFFIDGCNTYFYSNAFFMKKKYITNSIVLITNAATISTMYYKQSVNTLADNLLKESFSNIDLRKSVNYYMRNAKISDYQMLNVSSN